MKVTKLNSSKLVLLNSKKYLIDWNSNGASKIETQFKKLIFPYWKDKIVLEQCRIPGSLLRMDFLCVNNKLLVEINGEQHDSFNKFFHNNSRAEYLASINRDTKKKNWCESNNINVLYLNKEDLDKFSIKYIIDTYGVDLR